MRRGIWIGDWEEGFLRHSDRISVQVDHNDADLDGWDDIKVPIAFQTGTDYAAVVKAAYLEAIQWLSRSEDRLNDERYEQSMQDAGLVNNEDNDER